MSGAPLVVRGEVVAGSARTAVSRAVKEALQTCPGFRYDSLVVLLERGERKPPDDLNNS
jgi:arginine/lysine/ornithine decarboxylase